MDQLPISQQLRILCFGDSNTWGADPATGDRFPPEVRWPGVMASRLGKYATVIEEGLRGRTTVIDDPLMAGRSGLDAIGPCVLSHQPLDFLMIMLGTNDAKYRFNSSASEIAEGLSELVTRVGTLPTASPADRTFPIMLVAPPRAGDLAPRFAEEFEGAAEKLSKLAGFVSSIAARHHCLFFDGSEVIDMNGSDGIHFVAGAHHALGSHLANAIQRSGLMEPSAISRDRR